jgi:hypothetical protein
LRGGSDMARKKPPRYDRRKAVRRLARERVGIVAPSSVIEPATKRKKPKHKKPLLDLETGA